jgi:hypothetical protein
MTSIVRSMDIAGSTIMLGRVLGTAGMTIGGIPTPGAPGTGTTEEAYLISGFFVGVPRKALNALEQSVARISRK